MEAKLYGQNKGGMSINGIIKDYYAYAGENISAGDLVEFVNGVAGKTDYGESVDTDLVSTTKAGYVISAVKLDENRVFIAHSCNTTRLHGIVCIIEGNTIKYGTDTPIVTVDANGYELSAGTHISACLLPNGNVFIAHNEYGNSSVAANHLRGIVCIIEGTNITFGTDIAIRPLQYTGLVISVQALPNGNVFIAHSGGSNSGNYYLCGVVCTISGTTITVGADTNISTSANAGNAISTCLLPNGNVFIAHSSSSNYYLYGIVCTISGTTITAGSDTALVSSSRAGSVISTVTLPNGDVFIAHSYSSDNYLYGIVCAISGTTITKGNDTVLSAESNAGARILALSLQENKCLVIHFISDTSNMYGIICNINGTSVVAGTDTQILYGTSSISYAYNGTLLNNGTIFIAHCHTTGNYYLYAQIFGIDYENNIPTNNIIATDYETQVRKVTTGQFDGIAKTSGEGGDDTGHKDLVSIWTMPVWKLGEWIAQTSGTTSSLQDVIYGNNRYVAVGAGGTILVSEDGITWETQTSGVTSQISKVIYENNRYIAVGESGTILTSEDAITWVTQTSGVTVNLYGVAYGLGKYVVVGGSGTILTSEDAINWTSQNSGITIFLNDIVFADSKFVAVGQNGLILISYDGIVWETKNSGTTNSLTVIKYCNDKFVIGGHNGTIITSVDGIIWELQNSGVSTLFQNLAVCNRLIAISSAADKIILTSKDAITWEIQNNLPDTAYGLGAGNNKFVAVGYKGAILTNELVSKY